MSKEGDEAQKGKPAPLTSSLLERKGSASPSGFETPTITPIVIRAASLTPKPSNEETGLASDSGRTPPDAADSGDVSEPVVRDVRASDLREMFFESGGPTDINIDTAPGSEAARDSTPEVAEAPESAELGPAGEPASADKSPEAGDRPMFAPDPNMGRKATDWTADPTEDGEPGAGGFGSPEAAGDDGAEKPDPLFEMRFAEFMPDNEGRDRVAASRRRVVIVSSVAAIIAVLLAVVWSDLGGEISRRDEARLPTARTGIEAVAPTSRPAPADAAPTGPAKPAPVAELEAAPKAEAVPVPETVTAPPQAVAKTAETPSKQVADTPAPAPAPETVPAPPKTVAETPPAPAPSKQVADTPPPVSTPETVTAPPKTVAATPPAAPPSKTVADSPPPAPAPETVPAPPKTVVETPPAPKTVTAPPDAVSEIPLAPETAPAPPKTVAKTPPAPAPPKQVADTPPPAPAPKTVPTPPDTVAKTPPAPKPDSVPAGAQTAALPPPSSPGAYFVQLSSLRSSAAAGKEWSRLLRAYADILGGHALIVQRAEIKGRGTYFRVRTGGFETGRAARDFCARLKARKQGCLVVKR